MARSLLTKVLALISASVFFADARMKAAISVVACSTARLIASKGASGFSVAAVNERCHEIQGKKPMIIPAWRYVIITNEGSVTRST
jgi:cytochrome c553